jgi:hypothetical protein
MRKESDRTGTKDEFSTTVEERRFSAAWPRREDRGLRNRVKTETVNSRENTFQCRGRASLQRRVSREEKIGA